MRLSNFSVLQAYAISVASSFLWSGVHAGFPSEKFLDFKDKNTGKDAVRKDAVTPFAGKGEVTLLVRTSSAAGVATAAARGLGGKPILRMNHLDLVAINVPAADVAAAIAELRAANGVEGVQADFPVHALPVVRGYHGGAVKEEVPYGITMVRAADAIAKGADMDTTLQKVCVVDTGYDLGHEDLPNANEHGVTGYNAYPGEGKWHTDGNSHGTHCAGTIGAIGSNELGVVGVNPDPTKFSFHIGKGLTDSGTGSNAGVMAAVNSCVDAGARVISMSLGGGSYSHEDDAVFKNLYEEKRVLIIAAAGNDGNADMSYPASYPHVVSVAAVDGNENVAYFSQANAQVEIAGPGVDVRSTVPDDTYDTYSGTSMATPHVAGVAALVWSYFPSCSNHQIRGALLRTARDKGEAGCDATYGHGIVDAAAAFDLLLTGCDKGEDETGPSRGGCGQGETFSPTRAPTPCPAGTAFEVDLITDNYGYENSWKITDANGDEQKSRSGFVPYERYTETWCKDFSGCATFAISDEYGDGICCAYGEGSYTLTYNSDVIKSGGDFDSSESTEFGCPTPSPTPSPIPSNCLPCSNTATPKMVRKGLTCENMGSNGFKKKCNKNKTWRRKKFCQRRCFNEGLAYDSEPCCPLPPACDASCAANPLPWVAAPGSANKCEGPECKDCPECQATCIQGCYDLAQTSGKCAWGDCAGCTDCDQ